MGEVILVYLVGPDAILKVLTREPGGRLVTCTEGRVTTEAETREVATSQGLPAAPPEAGKSMNGATR